MKTKRFLSFTLIALMALVFVGFSSCSKDTAPSQTDLFLGTYKGKVTYAENGVIPTITNDNGSVLVSKVGDSYSFIFSDKIPAITNVKFEKQGDVWVGLSTGMTGVISVDAHTLKIAITKDGHGWTANGKR